MRDMDEVEAEQLERRQRKELTAKFKNFIKQVGLVLFVLYDLIFYSRPKKPAKRRLSLTHHSTNSLLTV